jgi:hypothetical protein
MYDLLSCDPHKKGWSNEDSATPLKDFFGTKPDQKALPSTPTSGASVVWEQKIKGMRLVGLFSPGQ